MNKLFTAFFLVLTFSFSFAQLKSSTKVGQMTPAELKNFRAFLKEKNLAVRDTVFIKYDFNKESCWNRLDDMDKQYINNVKEGFQKQITEFNQKHPNAVAYNFREPGNRLNKVKLWDTSILIDENLFLKNLLFQKKKECGTSVIILNDGSYLLNFSDPHFSLLSLVYGESDNKH